MLIMCLLEHLLVIHLNERSTCLMILSSLLFKEVNAFDEYKGPRGGQSIESDGIEGKPSGGMWEVNAFDEWR